MYIFMLSCYLLMIINFINFTISGAMVFFDIQFFGANHAQFSLLAILVFVLTETIVMYFFIATGKSIKNILIENNSSESERLWDKIKSIKGIIFPQIIYFHYYVNLFLKKRYLRFLEMIGTLQMAHVLGILFT